MFAFNDLQGSRQIMQMLTIQLIVLLAWLSNTVLVFAQLELSEAVTGSASFPDAGITCIGNLAVFVTSLLRGRLDLEMGARDFMAAVTGPKLNNINVYGIATCEERDYKKAAVVMLSFQTPNSSIKQFMKYISNAHHVESILLRCYHLKSAEKVGAEKCECKDLCRCIVFQALKEVLELLASQIPGTLKELPNSWCLLPCLNCLKKGCHGCKQDLLHVGEPMQRLTEGLVHEEFPAVVETLDYILPGSMEAGQHICLCVPMRPDDVWTNLLVRFFKSKDKQARGVIVMVCDALQNYMEGTGGRFTETEEYNTASFLVPRFMEVFVNLVLTGWFRLDGFSSSMVARRAIRDYVVDSKGSGFAANAFLTKAVVKSNSDNTDVCQLLIFRGNFLGIRTLSFIVGIANFICSIIWVLFVAIEGGAGKWYDNSMPPSKPRVAVIIVSIGIGLAMGCLELIFRRIGDGFRWKISEKKIAVLWAMIVFDICCIVLVSAIAKALDVKAFGRWLYSAMQALIWVKWGIGSYLLGEYSTEYTSSRRTWGTDGGILVYSSAFLLNAISAGVRGKWRYRKPHAD